MLVREEEMNISELRKLPPEDLNREIEALRKNLFEIRTKKVTDLVEKPHEIKRMKRDIARILTVLREKTK